jgi:hypothetical protein
MPVANALGTLSPTVVTRSTIQFLKKQFPALFSISTDFSDSAVLLNQNVVTRVVTPPPVHDFVAPNAGGTGYQAVDAATTTDITVAITKHKFASLSFSDTEVASTDRDLTGEQKQALAYSLGRQAMFDLCALITPTNFANQYAILAAANASKNTVVQLRKVLMKIGADFVNPFGLINADVFGALSEDPTVTSKITYGSVDPQVKGGPGSITGLGGFETITEYPELNPANGLLGYFGGKEGLLMAARVPQIPNIQVPGIITNVQDEDSGLTLQWREWYDMNGQHNITLTWMYGMATGVTGHAALLLLDAVHGNPS